MPTIALQPGGTVFVTGVNGLIGSHIADQLLKRRYHVRGAVRDVGKNQWLPEYFEGRYEDARFELVEVPDMTMEGCYDGVVDGVDGFIHVASPLGGFTDAPTAIAIGVKGALNALTACAKTPSIQRFVFTSSALAASFHKPDVEMSIHKDSYNEEAVSIVAKEPKTEGGLFIYAAMKTETEKAVWKWMTDNKPTFALNTILPDVNFGPVLIPSQQGFPSTIAWARAPFTGEALKEHAANIPSQWFISTVDTALLHVAALVYGDIDSERLFGYADRWTFNQLLGIFQAQFPDKNFEKDIEGLGVDKMQVPNERAEEVLRWVKGSGWDSLEDSLRDMSADWERE